MYEGRNIHYSQVDNKPLCSSSRKICRQRRLNGYAFCVRHVLEDPSAPFKSCEFITRSKLPCSNPIPKDDSRQYCNSHLQHMGQAPVNSKAARARERKASSAASKVSAQSTPTSTPSTPTTPPTPDSVAAAYMYDSRMTLADRLKTKFNMCQQRENGPHEEADPEDPYAFPEPQHQQQQLETTARLISPTKMGNRSPGILGKGPPNAVVSRAPSLGGDSRPMAAGSGHSPTTGFSPVSASGLSLKIQPGIKETLGLKESPQPALDVQQTGLGQNSPGRSSSQSDCASSLSFNQSETTILNQVGLSPSHNAVKSAVANYVSALREKHQQQQNESAASVTKKTNEDGTVNCTEKTNRTPGKRPGSSTPIAQLYPELAEKLERTRTKPDVKLKGDGKPKTAAQKNSRTMNRLQTKIAQNKIKDKLKKSEKVGPSLAMSLPNALTKEVAPNVTITPEMSALQAQLLSALPPRHALSRESKFPFASMGNMAPLMHKFSSERDAKNSGSGSSNRHSHRQSSQDEKGKTSLPPPYPYPPGVVPNPDVSTAAATLAAAAVAAAAKTAAHAHKSGRDAMHSPTRGAPSQLSPTGSYTSPTSSGLKDPRAATAQTAAVSSTSHPLLGLPPPHPAPHLMGHFPPGAALGGKHKQRLFAASARNTRGAGFVTRRKRRREPMAENEARRKLRRVSAVKFYAYHASQRTDTKDIVPLGVHSSSEDSDMEEELPWQRTWFTVSSDDENSDDDDEEDLAVYTRTAKLSLLRSRLRRRFNQLKKAQRLNKHCRTFQDQATRALIEAASRCPPAARDAVRATRGQTQTAYKAEDASHSNRKCKCKVEPESSPCTNRALPFTNHCVNHIMYNVDQHVFDYCTAKFSDNTQCCIPVFDVRHELPLCPEHAAKADNYNKCDLKPKKPRKKTKPSALTRPPKKGKKKKNQKKSVRPQKPILDDHTPNQSELSATLDSLGEGLLDQKIDSDEGEEELKSNASSTKSPSPSASQQPPRTTAELTTATTTLPSTDAEQPPNENLRAITTGSSASRETALTPTSGDARVRPEVSGDVMMTSAAVRGDSEPRRDVISPPPDMRELVNDITKSLETPDELDHPLLPSEIGTSLLPGLDDQTKFLDEHDLNEVLNKLPEEAFDIFTGLAEGKNGGGDFRQETEEFERALAEVSRHEKAAAEYKQLTGGAAGDAAYMSETDDGDELTKQIADSILNSQHLDDGDDNLDVAMPDDLNDQNLSDLASSISAHDLNSMSQSLTVSVLNSALDINAKEQNSAAGSRTLAGLQGPLMTRGLGNHQSARALQAHRQLGLHSALHASQTGVRGPGQLPVTFPGLQGQLGQLIASGVPAAMLQGGTVSSSMGQQRVHANALLAMQKQAHKGPNAAGIMHGPPNAVVQGSAMRAVTSNSESTSAHSSRSIVTTSAGSHAMVSPTSAGVVQNLLQSPPLMAPPNVHHHQHRPNILQSSRGSNMNHAQSFQIQGRNIQMHDPQRSSPGQTEQKQKSPQRNKVEGQGVKKSGRKSEEQESVIKAQLAQGLASAGAPPPQLQIQMANAIAALGGTPFAVSPRGAVSPNVLHGPKSTARAQQLAGQLFPSPPSSVPGVPMLVPPPPLMPGQINGNLLNATEQLKQLVSQSPVTLTPTVNNKKRSRNRRANSSKNSVTLPPAFCDPLQNHIASTANQSQQTTTTTLPLLTANQFRTDGIVGGGIQTTGGLKLALPLQALLPGDVSAVLTTVNGTTQESSKAAAVAAPLANHPKRSTPNLVTPGQNRKSQTNP